jgi:hypothetical protein
MEVLGENLPVTICDQKAPGVDMGLNWSGHGGKPATNPLNFGKTVIFATLKNVLTSLPSIISIFHIILKEIITYMNSPL